ncbi:MAG: aquaporin, partial [Chloroflexota bacterium]
GGIVGVQAASLILREAVEHPAVNHVATVPGMDGPAVAFLAELSISCLLMLAILTVSNTPRVARYTGLCAGLLVMTYIVLEAPLSGMSMNPARSLGSAVAAGAWHDLWIYWTAPPLGMLLAAELYVRLRGRASVRCAKLHHPKRGSCIFACRFGEASHLEARAQVAA